MCLLWPILSFLFPSWMTLSQAALCHTPNILPIAHHRPFQRSLSSEMVCVSATTGLQPRTRLHGMEQDSKNSERRPPANAAPDREQSRDPPTGAANRALGASGDRGDGHVRKAKDYSAWRNFAILVNCQSGVGRFLIFSIVARMESACSFAPGTMPPGS